MMARVEGGDDSGGRDKGRNIPTYFPSCNFLFLSFEFSPLPFLLLFLLLFFLKNFKRLE